MHKLNLQTFVLSTNDRGEKICTLQADPTKRFVLDDEGNMTKYSDAQEMSDDIIALDSENSSNDSCTDNFSSLHDQALDNHHEFEENLMNELDTGLMKMVESGNNQVIEHMDIREPLSKLRKLLERKLRTNLSDFRFTLQDSQFLDEDKNLVNQCVQGEGLVQINAQIEILARKINILDVLKPAEDYIHAEDVIEIDDDSSLNQREDSLQEPMETEDVQNLMQWQVDLAYKREQERLKIPFDPNDWTTLHVRHWIQWAVRQFNLSCIKLSDWHITGKDLFQLTMEDFQKIVPNDPGDLFWTHLELLRKMRLVATLRASEKKPSDAEENKHESKKTKHKIEDKTVYSEVAYLYHSAGNKTGNNGQIQLWQFLLELLTNKDYTSVIQWTGKDAEFKLTHPEVVAHLWGERKNKPTMNYEKLSRALRYYYDGDLISKVHGKRFVYKFVIDLKELLGYSATELANLVKHGNPTTLHWKVN